MATDTKKLRDTLRLAAEHAGKAAAALEIALEEMKRGAGERILRGDVETARDELVTLEIKIREYSRDV